MSVHTTILDFCVDVQCAEGRDNDCWLKEQLNSVLQDNGFQLDFTKSFPSGFILFFSDPEGNYASLRVYMNGQITLTVEQCSIETSSDAVLKQRITDIDRAVMDKIKPHTFRRLPPIKRGKGIDVYSTTSDDRLLEYDFDQILFEARSPFQLIKIFHSRQFGNMLCLDNLQNIADSDVIYTHTLMRRGIENYDAKTVLILGGGDGGLLNELLKEKPSFITMIEIDEMVLDACRKHLRGVCGNSLDEMKGPNHQIIVGDCVKTMKEYFECGRTFDYVISDLTDIPITSSPQGEMWDFICTIIEYSFLLLVPNGKFLTHGNGVNSNEALNMFERQLLKIDNSVEFCRHSAYIPSFMEMWVFYEAWKKDPTSCTVTNGK